MCQIQPKIIGEGWFLLYHAEMASKNRKLAAGFFDKPTLAAAEALLGKFLVREWPARGRAGRGRKISLMITEVEAYDGFGDRASHASRGKTARNAPMFGKPGHWYVYFTYGMHWLINIVTREAGYPAAVLIRAGKTLNGDTVGGPARVAKFLKVDGRFSGLPASGKTGLWIEDRRSSRGLSPEGGIRIQKKKVRRSPRIGVDYAGKYWAAKRWRLSID